MTRLNASPGAGAGVEEDGVEVTTGSAGDFFGGGFTEAAIFVL